MKKKMSLIAGTAVTMLSAMAVWAQEAAPVAVEAAKSAGSMNYFMWTTVFIAAGFSFTTAICGLGQGMAIRGGLEGIARQPEASDKIQIAMLLGLAFIESLALFALFIHIVLLFANPFLKYLQ